MSNYATHLEELIRTQGWEPSVSLPRRGDLLIWHGALIHGGTPMRNAALTRRSYVCHCTASAAHRAVAAYRVGEGLDFSEPPSLPPEAQPRSLPERIVNAARRRLGRLLA